MKFCIEEKGMVLGAWIVMNNHVHLIFLSKKENPQRLLQSFKSSTAKELIELISTNPQESKKERYLWLMELSAKRNNTTKNEIQFWQHHNKPIELWSNEAIQKNLDYLHFNPVESGDVEEPQYYLYSSAIDYAEGMLDININGMIALCHHAKHGGNEGNLHEVSNEYLWDERMSQEEFDYL